MTEYKGKLIGYVTIAEKDNAVEAVLSAVDNDYRKEGSYRSMISHIINYAMDNGKSFIT